ncbi:MAG: AAA family ATPase [Patescibacteria group bacterium]
MYLEKLEIQGFKTFAKKTVLSFLPPGEKRCPVTAVVGPNGSGKSNLADAIRWVLGEQSLKLLRGKQSEDVIFSGSEGRARGGFAEVSLSFNNEDGAMPIEYGHVTISRRLFRDGTSEYILNEGALRLSDIQLLLAQANVGQRSYSVIGQGMIDHILVSTPEERKAFFDDATGVKQFQIKRHEAMLKLKRTLENLNDLEMLMKEIEPRLRSLKRQANRLEERAAVEQELRGLEEKYYGSLWWTLVDETEEAKKRFHASDKTMSDLQAELKILEQKTKEMEGEDIKDEGLAALQKEYREQQKKCELSRRAQFETEKSIELSKVKAQSNWAPLPLSKIIEGVEEIKLKLEKLKKFEKLEEVMTAIDEVFGHSNTLVSRLQRPNPEDIKPDPELIAKLKTLQVEEKEMASQLSQIEKQIDSYAAKEQKVRTELIDSQRAFRSKQQELHVLEQNRNQHEITLARLEERSENLKREMDEFMKEAGPSVRVTRVAIARNADDLHPEIQRIRYKLELIGGIDPEIIKEYQETKTRFEFLETQVTDLQQAIASTEKIVKELDDQIEKQSSKVFGEINKKFQHYFKILFGGGSCNLVKLTSEEIEAEEVTPDRVFADTGTAEREKTDEIQEKMKKHEDPIVGVDIQATPPGKRMKSLNLLSGGERALTSIALLSAIMDVNPSPFVVLDEVDAALDEANTIRFASILDELSQKSQFIVITHNRATMEKADVLYGVTMGDDGVSSLLSVHLEDVVSGETARR